MNRYVFTGSGYTVGEFWCPPGAPRWREVNWIGDLPHVVIPSTPVSITAVGGDPYVSTANEVLVYDADVHYRRGLISAHGDRCLFLEVGAELAGELALASGRPGLRYLPLSARRFAQHRLVRALRGTDEWFLDLLTAVSARLGPRHPEMALSQRKAVEQLKLLLAQPRHRELTLAEYASHVHYSPFTLARMFRAQTGYSIGQFRQQLRLRESLAEVLEHKDLSAVAADHRFSSHSHYTSAFRRAFGLTPSQLRASYVNGVEHGGRDEQVHPAVAVDVA